MELSRKLQIRPGGSVAVIDAPAGLELDQLGSRVDDTQAGDVVIGFARTGADVDRLGALFDAARADRLAWVCYPKAGRLGTDLNRDRLAEMVRARGVQPVRQIAVDDTWSALRLRPATS